MLLSVFAKYIFQSFQYFYNLFSDSFVEENLNKPSFFYPKGKALLS